MYLKFLHIFLILFLVFPVYSQSDEDDEAGEILAIPDIIITSERIEQTSRSSTATVNILSWDIISENNITAFDRALETIPGLTLNRSAGTATNSVSIRGASDLLGGGVGNRVLLLIDGRPAITADTGGANWSMLPMGVVDRVEVVKGALSPLYGSNAMGGVVNFITKSPSDSRKTRINMGLGYYEKPPEWMQYRDKRDYFGDISITQSDTYGGLGYVLDLGLKNSDGYRQNTDFSLYNAYGKMQYVTDNNLKINFSAGRNSLDRGYPHTWLINNQSPFVHPLKIAYPKTNDRQTKDSWNINLSLDSPVGSNMKLSGDLYHFKNYSKSIYNPNGLEGDNQPEGFFTDSDARKTGGILQLDMFGLERNYLILGLDLQMDSVNSHPPDMMFGKHRAETLAGFAQDKITITDKLIFMVGARYDYRNIEDGIDEGQLSPKAGISYQLNDDASLRLSAGQAFRSPSLAEIYLREELHAGIEFVENKELRSEKLRFYSEFGIRRKFFNFLNTDTAIFVYDFSDMIFWQPIGNNQFQVTNLSRSTISGIETGFNIHWKDISCTANYTYLDAKDKTQGRSDDNLPYKPKHTAYGSLGYQFRGFQLQTSLRYVSKIDEVIFYANDNPEAFYVIDSQLSYRLSNNLRFSVIIDNLLDRQYEEMARYRRPGRSVSFRLMIGE
ncbi:TonB-dependent receptor plug domain-containing protein [Candidatus Poribacteria bacterium]|nr:TonB-dependent receptor plug domain-containing protein [Candidatus Poribacteria bacterium]